jgi:CDP-glycerol glycerophosphotransferase
LRTTDELADALRNIDDVRAQYAGTYSAFAAVFCELDDGRATARVVDRLFSTTEDAAIPHPAYGL